MILWFINYKIGEFGTFVSCRLQKNAARDVVTSCGIIANG